MQAVLFYPYQGVATMAQKCFVQAQICVIGHPGWYLRYGRGFAKAHGSTEGLKARATTLCSHSKSYVMHIKWLINVYICSIIYLSGMLGSEKGLLNHI